MGSGARLLGSVKGVKRQKNDLYCTPEYAVRELLKRETFTGLGWEPASGTGNIAKCFPGILASDIGTDSFIYGKKGIDFLKTFENVDFIITNPPFKLSLEFVRHALKCARKKVAFFLKIQFLEGKGRHEFFKEYPPIRIYVFVKRVPCTDYAGEVLGTIMCFCWFIWEKGFRGKPIVEWIE